MSYSLGIDIGTSKAAAVITDCRSREMLSSASIGTNADIPTPETYSEQDADMIFEKTASVIRTLDVSLRNKISEIGVTGQMHGVILWNKSRKSPLYTWKDRRTAENGFIAEIKKKSGCAALKEGFGNSTLAYFAAREQLSEWTCAATIHDYFVSEICSLSKPVSDPSDAASWGLFDIRKKQWDNEPLKQLGIPINLLPSIVKTGTEAGRLSEKYAKLFDVPAGIPVYAAFGDNQASILGTASKPSEEIYITIGTGAQLSLIVDEADLDAVKWPETVELRPFMGRKYLAVAAPLCGGQAFAWLIKSIQKWLDELGIMPPPEKELYRAVDILAVSSLDTPLSVAPNFLGERYEPSLRGIIQDITLDNFSLGNLSAALAEGIVKNMYTMMPQNLFEGRKLVICSGNAVRRLEIMRKMIFKVFALPLKISSHPEEAAFGASLINIENNRFHAM